MEICLLSVPNYVDPLTQVHSLALQKGAAHIASILSIHIECIYKCIYNCMQSIYIECIYIYM